MRFKHICIIFFDAIFEFLIEPIVILRSSVVVSLDSCGNKLTKLFKTETNSYRKAFYVQFLYLKNVWSATISLIDVRSEKWKDPDAKYDFAIQKFYEIFAIF